MAPWASTGLHTSGSPPYTLWLKHSKSSRWPDILLFMFTFLVFGMEVRQVEVELFCVETEVEMEEVVEGPAGGGDGEGHPVGVEVVDELGGAGLGEAGGEEGGQVGVELLHQVAGGGGQVAGLHQHLGHVQGRLPCSWQRQ